MAKDLPLKDQTKEALYGRWQGMLDAAAATGQPLTAELKNMCDAIEQELDARDKVAMLRGCVGLRHDPDRRSRPAGGSGFGYMNAKTGSWVRAVGADESIADATGDQLVGDSPSLGGMIVGAATGKWNGLERERAAVMENSDPSGGFLVSQRTSASFIDRARSHMVLTRAGMRTIPFGDGAELKIGRVGSDPISQFRHEGTAVAASSPTFEAIVLRPRLLACLVPCSVEWLEDVGNGQALIEDVIARSMAVALDESILRGDAGAAEPTGIKDTTGVHSTAVAGPWSYDTLVDSMKLIWDSNGPTLPTACILSPASEAWRRKLKNGDGNFFLDDGLPTRGVPFMVTSFCPSTELYIGDFSRVILAVKTALKVEILAAGTGSDSGGKSYNATDSLYRWIRCYTRIDSHIEMPTHMAVLTGLTNS